MEALTVTIIGGVVVAIIALAIEYGYIQRKRRKTHSDPLNTLNSVAINSAAINTPAERPSLQGTDEISWPEAINKAIENFSILHKRSTIELRHTETDESLAWVRIYVWKNSELSAYNLTIDKQGKILKMDQD